MDFTDKLSEACAGHEAGFHFEEGGCFAMAVAIAERLSEDGVDARLAVMCGVNCHAYALANGRLYDHLGDCGSAARLSRLLADMSAEEVRAYALSVGHSDDDFDSDLAWAREIVATAVELSGRPVLADGRMF